MFRATDDGRNNCPLQRLNLIALMYIDSAIVRSSKRNLSKYHNTLYIHLYAAEPNTHINSFTLHNVADLFLCITKRYQRHRFCITPIFLKELIYYKDFF